MSIPIGAPTTPRPRAIPGARLPWLTAKDVAVLAKLPVSLALAWGLPERAWAAVAWRAAGLERGGLAKNARRIEAMLGPGRLSAPALEIARRQLAQIRLDQLQFLRSWRPGGGWRPELELAGWEHLDAALALGRGAILWVAPTVHQWLLTKRTLAEAGYAVHHLSSYIHGFSIRSRLGEALLNPIRTRVEDRYLAERVRIGAGGNPQAALRRLTALLGANRVVSITVAATGVRPLAAPFLNGSLRVGSGAPHLAARTGAALLPVLTLRRGTGRFATRIEAPIAVPPGHGPDAALAATVAEYARRLEPQVLAHPDQVTWGLGCLDPRPAPASPPPG